MFVPVSSLSERVPMKAFIGIQEGMPQKAFRLWGGSLQFWRNIHIPDLHPRQKRLQNRRQRVFILLRMVPLGIVVRSLVLVLTLSLVPCPLVLD